MAKSAIPIIDPNRFVREFMAPAAWAERANQATGNYPTANFLAVGRLEEYVSHIRFPIPVARNSHYDFFLITKGHLLLTDGLQTYSAGENSLILRAAGTITGVDECHPATEGFYGLFDAEYVLYNLKNQNSLNELPFFGPDATPVITLLAEELADFGQQLTKIETQHLSQKTGNQAYGSALLYSFLLDAARLYAPMHPDEPNPPGNVPASAASLTNRFKNLLKHHILSKRAVRDYADLLSVTPNHLNRCVKDMTGKPVSSWLTDALLLEAKVLLRQTNQPIADIAFQLSIEDVSYFARVFKKHTGQSPTDYRDSSTPQP